MNYRAMIVGLKRAPPKSLFVSPRISTRVHALLDIHQRLTKEDEQLLPLNQQLQGSKRVPTERQYGQSQVTYMERNTETGQATNLGL